MVSSFPQRPERTPFRLGRSAITLLVLLAAASPSVAAPTELDALFAARDWPAYEAALATSLEAPTSSALDRAIATVRLASFRHAIRQQGFAESVESLPPAIATLETAAPSSPWLAEGHAQLATAFYRLQRIPDAVAPATAGADLARRLLATADLDETTRIRLYTAFNVRASIHMLSGEEAAASALFDETITALETLAPNHPQLGSAYVNHGLILYNFGRFRELADAMTKAGRIFADGANPVALAATRTNHGLALNQLGRYAEAEPLLADGVARFEAIGASRAPIYANAIQNWGIAAGYLGQTDAALARINTALELRTALYGEDHFEVAVTLAHRARVHLQAGDFTAAVADSTPAADLTAALADPTAHLDLELTVLDVHLRCLAAAGRIDDLHAIYPRYVDRLERFTRHQLAYGHEGERLGFLDRHDPVSAALATGDASLVGEALLHYRGLVSAAFIEDVQLAAQADAADLAAWRAALRSPETDTSTLAALEARLATSATELGAPRRALDLHLADLTPQLQPGDTVLVFFLHQPWADGPTAPTHYGAWTLSPGQTAPTLHDLGPRAKLDAGIAAFLTSFDPNAPAVQSLAARLHALLPATTRRALIVPEASLHQLPFAALPYDADSFWAEHLSVLHLTSPRDLIPTTIAIASPDTPHFAAIGAPDFGSSTWAPLPAAALEVDQLTTAATAAGWTTHPATAADATETQLRALSADTTHLHLATHGFALADRADTEPSERLAASGLILAQPRFDAWTDGRTELPLDPTDGVLTALEIMPLDLRGVQLVTLAACTSANGSIAPNEGLYGLPQAFRRAGAGSVVAALWPIDDDAARDWMIAFYEQLFAGASIDAAFAATQAAQLRAIAADQGPAAAIRRAGAWMLSYRAPHAD
ncbi:CHAT domain-containing protein [Actomonas aquatica]|uniref:CHAT domain-containing tetratricopeptide repeat protein n=1 Tax=Actomonas aquatica TaxID=2866162 RepID=A0ABZ1C1Y2_9BACT|nr:CHAT domain-containing tetratricopeptide repeat protein [Opitutus sp. WL0086]WRQ85662.1 CHAT domain-containing tetratricopeptide repeat protein [Opitutus sp. WL0086]